MNQFLFPSKDSLPKFPEIPTPPVTENGVVDVRKRLYEIKRWYNEWEEEDRVLEQEVFILGQSKEDLRRGSQIQHLRKIIQLKIVRFPILLDNAVVESMGYDEYRQNLANQFASLTADEKIDWMLNFMFIMTPDLSSLGAKMDKLIGRVYLGQGRNLLIGGHSGMGKTIFLRWLASHYLPKVLLDRNDVPIVMVTAPVETASIRPLYHRILLGVGKGYFSDDDPETLLDRIILYFQQCCVRLLIIDEIEELKRKSQKRRVLELSNVTNGVCIACASCDPEKFVAGDIEIRGRWNDKFILEQYTGRKLQQILSFVDMLLPFPNPSNLPNYVNSEDKKGGEGIANFIEKATGGILRDIMTLITDASLKAIVNGDPNISLDLLRSSWDEIQNSQVTDFLQLYNSYKK